LHPPWAQPAAQLADALAAGDAAVDAVRVDADGTAHVTLRRLWDVDGVGVDVHPTPDARGTSEVRVVFPDAHASVAHDAIDRQLGDADIHRHTIPATNIDEDDLGWTHTDAKILARIVSAGGNTLSATVRILPADGTFVLVDGSSF
jgi:hypothetical protein